MTIENNIKLRSASTLDGLLRLLEQAADSHSTHYHADYFHDAVDVIEALRGASGKLVPAPQAEEMARYRAALEQISALRGYRGEDMARVAVYRVAAEIAEQALQSATPMPLANRDHPKPSDADRCRQLLDIINNYDLSGEIADEDREVVEAIRAATETTNDQG